MITKDNILKAAEICTMGGDHGELCPNCPLDNEKAACVLIFAEYIKENEPAPAATGTSSEILKNINSTHLDDSTKEQICQAYDTADKACADILDIYEGMSECERRAFDIGEAYGKICSTRCKLEELIGASGREGE